MKRAIVLLVLTASAGPLCAAVPGMMPRETPAATGPYQPIVERNVFGLKPPPPPPDPEANKPPPPKIILTGITTILGHKRAWMKTPPGPAKPGEKSTEHFYMLGVGEREDGIEVLAIDEKNDTVKVSNDGQVATLDFVTNGQKSSPGAPGAPQPGGVVAPPALPGHFPNRSFPMPGRMMRSPGNGSTGQAYGGQAGAYGGQVGAYGGQAGAYGGQLGAYGGQAAPANVNGVDTPEALAAAAQRTPEENVLLYEANQQRDQQLIQQGVRLPPMPHHPYLNGGPGGGPQAPQ